MNDRWNLTEKACQEYHRGLPIRAQVMRSNRDKTRRIIPKMANGWASYPDIELGVSGFLVTGRVPQPYLGNQTEDDWDHWTILRLHYGSEGVEIPVLIGFSEDTQSSFSSHSFRATEERYTCINMPRSIRESFVAEHFRDCDLSDIDNRIPGFFVHLQKIAKFNRVVTKGSQLTYEFRYFDQPPVFLQ